MKTIEPNRNTLANNLADQIRADIPKAGLAEGDFFMTGDEIAGKYGVSRVIAREAISQLRSLGILKSRQSKGLIIGKSDIVDLMEQGLPFCVSSDDDLNHLAELRYCLEIGAIDMAVENSTSAQLARLSKIAEKYEKVVKTNPESPENDQLEIEFHSQILKLTHNPLIIGMHNILTAYFREYAMRKANWTANYERTAWEHKAIAESFCKRDTEMARAFLRRHLKNIFI